jgi:hypothetical protein
MVVEELGEIRDGVLVEAILSGKIVEDYPFLSIRQSIC